MSDRYNITVNRYTSSGSGGDTFMYGAYAQTQVDTVMLAVVAVEMVVVAKIHFQLPNQTKQNHILLGLIYQMTLNFYQVHLELISR